jgi:hypothetical protein
MTQVPDSLGLSSIEPTGRAETRKRSVSVSPKQWRMRSMLLLLSPVLLLPSGCEVLGYDHRKQVSLAILSEPNGTFDESALTASLLTKFPVGSPPAPLEDFVKTLSGKCTANSRGGIHCNIPLSGAICVSHSVNIEADVDNGAIVTLHAWQLNQFC